MSPYGLGISGAQFWSLTLPEWDALRFFWAESRADFYNAHFVSDGISWHPEDFLGTDSREKRKARRTFEQAKAEVNKMRYAGLQKKGVDEAYLAKYAPWALQRGRHAGNR